MTTSNSIVEAEILKELPSFEIFFSRIGFKRIDGSVFGLLVLAKKPLTSEEIEQTLNLSQSAVSLSLKTLTHFGAIETTGDRDNQGSKAKLHSAKEDSLAIVASVFRKREEEVVADFKRMAQRVLDKSQSPEDASRKRRMQSIVTTCEIAESVMHFVITMAHNKTRAEFDAQYEAMVKRLPKALDLLATTAGPLADITMTIKDNLTEKFKNNLKGIYEKR
ncbi:hypothetical protein DOM21_10585 [Bacteriovorax stolpii]|uniref:Uncharacterized protein n=1 Tax=Bacteriovorax stolpii TaxID=960 RepID=A0A2K9NRH8_BACTC|nr:hypothetical protein [Bacteriovorax stolpii]AUN98136.1 hypothetical protein C0V70_08440 [Bacteriovorax stolpii]QDK41884.1 hypothetical protein DOM21_10585 [Bacteriovorax stolpii]TDP52049.1 DNA-binding transcriptional regulator GbsR (MarR family) [Bacteriovorax stolpii]BDT28232.1 hypothetical protein BHI3_16980 [Bacteriovorax sp. HI3]